MSVDEGQGARAICMHREECDGGAEVCLFISVLTSDHSHAREVLLALQFIGNCYFELDEGKLRITCTFAVAVVTCNYPKPLM